MAFTGTNPTVVGNPTKKDDYDDSFDNTKANRDLVLGDNAQASGETGHGHTGTGANDGVKIEKEAIASTDHPIAARSFLVTESTGISLTWNDSSAGGFDDGGNMDTFDFGGGDIRARYQAPTDGVYYVHAHATHDDLTALSITDDGGTAIAVAQDVDATGADITTLVLLSANDYLKFAYSHSAGGNFTTGTAYTFFEVFKLPFTTDY
jgi:hypothetical protein